MKIGFIGLGETTFGLAEALATAGNEVYGFDYAKKTSLNIKMLTSIEDVVTNSSIIFIGVPAKVTFGNNGLTIVNFSFRTELDYTSLSAVLREVSNFVTEEHTVVIKTKLNIGALRREFSSHVPNLIYNPGSIDEIVNGKPILIGTDDSTPPTKLVDFYKSYCTNLCEVGTWEDVETIGMLNEYYRLVTSVIAGTVTDIAERVTNMDAKFVVKHLDTSTIDREQLGCIIGGKPVTNLIAAYDVLRDLSVDTEMVTSLIRARERHAYIIAEYICYYAQGEGKPVFIHGRSDSAGSKKIDGSFSILVAKFIQDRGVEVTYVDPNTGDYAQPLEPCVMLLAHNTKELYCSVPNNSIVVDLWWNYEDSNSMVLRYGDSKQFKLNCMV